MKSDRALVLLVLAILPGARLRAQVSEMIPPEGRAMLDSADRASPEDVRARKRYLDSLTAGLARWQRAGVTEYRIQTHFGCFCAYRLDEVGQSKPLLHVRDNEVIAREPGKPITVPADTTLTVDRLFDLIEKDAGDIGRRIKKLILDPTLGFPREYSAETANIPDAWITFTVDSFSVVRSVKSRTSKRHR